MKIKQFYDDGLAHASYAIISKGKAALIDPARDPKPYLDFAKEQKADIVAVFETHPHADFVSSHLELHTKAGATIYINGDMGAAYPHQILEDGEEVQIGEVTIRALYTPGHSPDHSTYLLIDEAAKPHAVFTGDSLFVGDVGRPDLREGAGKTKAQRKELARKMYHTINHVFKSLDDDIIVYPAHGAGSLCGKNMSSDKSSTIGREKEENWAFQIQQEEEFVKALLEDQPFVPHYFPYDVEVNRTGASPLEESIRAVSRQNYDVPLEKGVLIVDTRPKEQFKQGHFPGAFNIMNGEKFETWLGSIVKPEEPYYLIAENEQELDEVIRKAAKIGYEKQIRTARVVSQPKDQPSAKLDLEHFKEHPDAYQVVDLRNLSEGDNLFEQAQRIPLHELRERVEEIKTDKPVVVHCAGGYRSAAGSSILEGALDTKVYDLSEAVKDFTPQEA
ncbi:MBL fold metallo-hydrolase [Catalinimonas niigatensis]|uniref:MBL fold metallo-hydrolase n=1 Tax=Catalinimonas niigatensis TaxID=1397264 RepID=UPI0026658F35|nr:MBL fold metallo-hydrolase [Catalinimonas niigatensis]WPP48337.1 MBL fold metallo-hydrolase [Catalinimonas niigatensis]